MKNKKQLIVLIIFGGLMLVGIQSCQKYTDGPLISLRSRTTRVANTWQVDNYKLNDVDYTSLVAGYTETYSKDGNYSFSWGILAGTGTWKFQNNDAEIRITGIADKPS